MTAFLDISIIKSFSSLFTFILVFVIIYGLLESFKVFGEGKKGSHAMIAVVIAFLVSISNGVVTVIQTFTPWFTILILVIFFILFAVRMFGVDSGTITKAFANNKSILTWIIILTVVILLFSLGSGFGQTTLEEGQGGKTTSTVTTSTATNASTSVTDTGNFNQNLYNTLYHPKVLGLILIMLIVVVAMLLLTGVDKV